MAGRRSKLTPEVHNQIVTAIRAGAFDWVAAEAAGISKATYYRWLQRGEAARRGPYREFWVDVRQARAQARVAAETEVRRDNPLAWLRRGPGRTRRGEPGWTEGEEWEEPGRKVYHMTLNLTDDPEGDEDDRRLLPSRDR